MHDLIRPVFSRSGIALALAGTLIGAVTLVAPTARADDFVDRVNGVYKPIPTERRSDLILLPLLEKITPPPPAVATLEQAAIVPADLPTFSQAAAWSSAAPQQAVLKALHDVTQEKDWRRAYVFGLPYGVEEAPPAIVRARLHSELGDPPTLAAAQHHYLAPLDRVAILVNVEATRLLGEGKPNDAIEVLTDWAFFCRSMCDRQFLAEVSWGLRNLIQAQERIRDVAYTDLRGARALNTARLLTQIKRLANDDYLDLGRITFPTGDRAGTEQMIARVYVPRGRVDDRIFGPAMARLGSSQHPLRLFSETARWRQSAGSQVDWDTVSRTSKGVYDDWAGRWIVEWFDRRHVQVTEWEKIQPSISGYAVIQATTPDLGALRPLRQLAKVEGVGTRTALAVVGATYDRGNQYPPQLSAVRPRWVPALEDDPYNVTARQAEGKPPLEYFVPMRNTPRNALNEPEPYEVSVVTNDPAHPLVLRLKDDSFVLYSWGSDNAKNLARRTQNTAAVVQGADYLIWPPVVSLQRQNMIDLGTLR
ncbi:hypothetical protein PHYC_01075 [Phycisphaerales bacterium]|nr:hypothetical protein PHYC_01075 [Phycisphaerales bacterium]